LRLRPKGPESLFYQVAGDKFCCATLLYTQPQVHMHGRGSRSAAHARLYSMTLAASSVFTEQTTLDNLDTQHSFNHGDEKARPVS
jgi:hypothetical protein